MPPFRDDIAAHAEQCDFVSHLTVARAKSLDLTPLVGYKGPWWTSSELVLLRSEQVPSGYRYSALGVVLLRGPS
jgi:2'-5' RNA ligase